MENVQLAPGTYVVAVSGGVDSMVLLDVLARQADTELIIAHFDHGIRTDSAHDAEFVQAATRRYSLTSELGRATLGAGASEEVARKARYAFLTETAKKYQAQIVTGHHADDVIETIAINIFRGTGWRGLVSLRDDQVKRPLLRISKNTIVGYAQAHGLEWREDSTNHSQQYLRNRIRQKLRVASPEVKQKLFTVYEQQLILRSAVDAEITHIIEGFPRQAYSRYFFIMINDAVATELLNVIIQRDSQQGATRPQLSRALTAIKTYRSGARHDISHGVCLVFTSTTFIVELSQS